MKKIYFTLLICLVLSLALTSISLAKDCARDADCLSESFCRYSSNGLTYGYYCCLEEAGCTVEGWYGECVLNPDFFWCEDDCCDEYCDYHYGTRNGTCYDSKTCICEGEPEGLSAPTNLSPSNGSTVSLTPNLSWTKVDGAVAYVPWVDGGAAGAWSDVITGTSATVPAGELTEGATYTWKVKACPALPCHDPGPYSIAWSFTTAGEAPPDGDHLPAPINPTPRNGATNISLTPTLYWSPVTGAIAYLAWIPGEWEGIASYTTYITVPAGELKPGKTYTWKVRACSDAGCITVHPWSEPWSFTTASAGDGGEEDGDGVDGGNGFFKIENPLKYDNFEDLVDAIILFLIQISIPLAAIMFVISGIVFVTSVGNAERVRTAQRIALYTAVGLAVILIASGLIKVLQNLLTGS